MKSRVPTLAVMGSAVFAAVLIATARAAPPDEKGKGAQAAVLAEEQAQALAAQEQAKAPTAVGLAACVREKVAFMMERQRAYAGVKEAWSEKPTPQDGKRDGKLFDTAQKDRLRISIDFIEARDDLRDCLFILDKWAASSKVNTRAEPDATVLTQERISAFQKAFLKTMERSQKRLKLHPTFDK